VRRRERARRDGTRVRTDIVAFRMPDRIRRHRPVIRRRPATHHRQATRRRPDRRRRPVARHRPALRHKLLFGS
jgi:hypothetical protein